MFLSSKYILTQLFPLIYRGFLFDLLTYGSTIDVCYFSLILGFGRRRHTNNRKCDYGDPYENMYVLNGVDHRRKYLLARINVDFFILLNASH